MITKRNQILVSFSTKWGSQEQLFTIPEALSSEFSKEALEVLKKEGAEVEINCPVRGKVKLEIIEIIERF